MIIKKADKVRLDCSGRTVKFKITEIVSDKLFDVDMNLDLNVKHMDYLCKLEIKNIITEMDLDNSRSILKYYTENGLCEDIDFISFNSDYDYDNEISVNTLTVLDRDVCNVELLCTKVYKDGKVIIVVYYD